MPEEADVEWPPYLSAYAMELKFQLAAAKSSFDSLENHIAKRKELASGASRAAVDVC
jgi:hypothetical protein